MSGKPPYILVIDHDASVCEKLTTVLTQEGFDVAVATSGTMGVQACCDRWPDLVLLEVVMPEMDGISCIQAIQALGKSAQLPIAMLTATDDETSIHRAFDLGALDFISKPIHWPTLAYRIRSILRSTETLNQLSKNELTLRNAQRLARLGHWEWDVASDHLRCSEEAMRVLGLPSQMLQKQGIDNLLRIVHTQDAGKMRKAAMHCLKNGVPFNMDYRCVHADGSEHVIHTQGSPVYDEHDAIVQINGLVQDITEFRRIEDQVRLLSHYDGLTGLANRTTFKEILTQGVSYCDRYSSKLAALFISIDKFNRINEVYGPEVGDIILRQFTERLEHTVRASDFISVSTDINYADATISRLGGNEFTVLTNHIRDSCDMVKIVTRIIQNTRQPYIVGGHEMFLTVSIGICVYPGDGFDVDSFIQNGEFAMRHAREQGGNHYEFFSKSLSVEVFKKLALESSLRKAMDRNELLLHYQPKFDVTQGCMVGMEALIRWKHPELGLVPPFEFIPLAEESGLIIPIGEWVIQEACRQNRAWQTEGLTPIPVAVNVSSVQFAQKDFAAKVVAILESTGLPPSCLELEMTESILMSNVSNTMHTLKQLKSMGIKISVDDFGTGYSSLSYLSKFPIDELKVDRSFVMNVPDNRNDAAIAAAIIALARSLGLQVVAEGVETREQSDFLVSHGCAVIQGYLYSRPVPASQIPSLVTLPSI